MAESKFKQIQETDQQTQISGKTDSENKTIFRLGQDLLTYQMFKLNQRPKSHSDFANALQLEIESSDNIVFELDEIVINNGKVSIVQGSTRKSIADWDILVSKLNELGVDSDLIIRETTSKPSLRITSLK